MTKKVLFTHDFGEQKMDQIRALGVDLHLICEEGFQPGNIAETARFLAPLLSEIDALICYAPFTHLDISKMDKLKLLQLTSIGFNHIPTDIIVQQGISVCNNKGGYSIPIAEWIVMNTLQMMKANKQYMHNQQQKRWHCELDSVELYGKTIGFAGTGAIAQEAAKRLAAFDVTILGLNTNGRDVEHFDRCYALSDSMAMLPQCDVVVGLLPGTQETNDFFDANSFCAMKDGVYFINAARGSIVDEDALLENLRSGKIRSAVLDVFKTEPLPAESPFWDLDNVYITPHSSGYSEMLDERPFKVILSNLKNLLADKPFINTVNLQRGY